MSTQVRAAVVSLGPQPHVRPVRVAVHGRRRGVRRVLARAQEPPVLDQAFFPALQQKLIVHPGRDAGDEDGRDAAVAVDAARRFDAVQSQ